MRNTRVKSTDPHLPLWGGPRLRAAVPIAGLRCVRPHGVGANSPAHRAGGACHALSFPPVHPSRVLLYMYPQPIPFIIANWPLVAVLVISGSMLVWPFLQGRLSHTREVGAAAATQLINRQNAVLLDLREPKEYAAGRLPNALHIPLAQLATRGQELAKFIGRPIIAYCDRGNQSRTAAAALGKLGFTEVFTLHGGLRAWSEAGMPLEKG